jgi:ComF family protein
MNLRRFLRSAARGALDAALALVFAPPCAACARPLDSPSSGCVCARCWASVRTLAPPLCRTCGDALPSWRVLSVDTGLCAHCRRSPPLIVSGRAGGEYEGALRDIVHAFKYDGRRTLAAPLGRLMVSAGREVLDGAHCAIPVPLHPWRQLRRGFNQAADLATATGLPVVHALWRTRATRAQAGLTAAARRRNVRQAFRLSPLRSRHALDCALRDRIVVLVDDVMTTGATLQGCAQVLKQAGAREVRALTVARARVRQN